MDKKQKAKKTRRILKAWPAVRRPVTPSEQLESELWAAQLGFCGWWQLAALPGRAEGVPKSFSGHPFRFLDHKEQAAIKKQAATRTALRKAGKGRRFYMDFVFFCAFIVLRLQEA